VAGGPPVTAPTAEVAGGPPVTAPTAEVAGGPPVTAPTGGTPATVNELRDRGLYDHGEYPFYMDICFPEEGSITGYGYIDLCKDAQRQIDLMNNAIVANCVVSATPRWLTKIDENGINEEEFIDWTKPIVHHQGSIDESMLKQIVVNPLSGNYLGILENKIEELKETSGNRDVNNGGAAAGVTAASAIAAMQEQSGKLSRDQNKGSYRVVEKVYNCGVELVRQFYDAPRTFRILGQNGQMEFSEFDNTGLKPVLVEIGYGNKPGLRAPVFDIEVVASKQSGYSRISQNELALQFFQLGFFNPQYADQALATTDMMDFKGKDEVQQRIQQNGGMYQQIQQLQMQVQQLLAMLGRQAPMAAPTAAPTAAPAPQTGEQTTSSLGGVGPALVERARQQAQEATQPR
jgi:hypothetical protein